ncbi:hypothetical protein LXL04_021586 [Taraxacum kok-saghyz]
MNWNPNLILYTCIAKDTTVLAEFNSKDEHLSDLAKKCLEKTPPFHSIFSHTVHGKTYMFFILNRFIYFGIFDESLEKPQCLLFLKSVKDAFTNMIDNRRTIKQRLYPPIPHCFQREFTPVFHHLLSSNPSSDSSSDSTHDHKEENLEESNSTPPSLLLFSQRFNSPESGGGFTPPPCGGGATVPFQWEVAPGKPRHTTVATASDPPSRGGRSLDLPPRMFVPSPTSVLDGPYSLCSPKKVQSKWKKKMMMMMPLRKMIMSKDMSSSFKFRSWSWDSFTDISSRGGSGDSSSSSYDDDFSNTMDSNSKIKKVSMRHSLMFFNKTTSSILSTGENVVITVMGSYQYSPPQNRPCPQGRDCKAKEGHLRIEEEGTWAVCTGDPAYTRLDNCNTNLQHVSFAFLQGSTS